MLNSLEQELPQTALTIGIALDNKGKATLTATESHLAPGESHVHAGAVVTLADSACGLGSRAAFTSEAGGFITIELKAIT